MRDDCENTMTFIVSKTNSIAESDNTSTAGISTSRADVQAAEPSIDLYKALYKAAETTVDVGAVVFFELDKRYYLTETGNFFSKVKNPPTVYNGAIKDLNGRFVSFKGLPKTAAILGHISNGFTTVIMIKDATNITTAAIQNNLAGVVKGSETLILDASGAYLGYISPTTGLFIGAVQLFGLSPHVRQEIAINARREMNDLVRKGEDHSQRFETLKKVYYQYCNCAKPSVPDTIKPLQQR